jgi:hypothetical protein
MSGGDMKKGIKPIEPQTIEKDDSLTVPMEKELKIKLRMVAGSKDQSMARFVYDLIKSNVDQQEKQPA